MAKNDAYLCVYSEEIDNRCHGILLGTLHRYEQPDEVIESYLKCWRHMLKYARDNKLNPLSYFQGFERNFRKKPEEEQKGIRNFIKLHAIWGTYEIHPDDWINHSNWQLKKYIRLASVYCPPLKPQAFYDLEIAKGGYDTIGESFILSVCVPKTKKYRNDGK